MVQPITIAPYDLEWPAVYAAERDRLATACSALPIRIEHIGSTSVPGLAAKPIVDVMVGLHPSADLDACVEPITSLGYRYIARYQEGDDGMPFRRYFNQRSDGTYGSFNLHVVHEGSNFWQRQVAFRDCLRTDPETCQAYERVKRELAPRFTDPNAYADAKTDFIEGVLLWLGVRPQIRRIQPGDGPVLKALRLAAVKDAPDAFGSTLAETQAQSDERWSELARRRASSRRAVTFFAEDNAAPCGIVGGTPSDEDPSAADLVSMWVAPNHRRRGVGRMLVDRLIAWAREVGYTEVELWVTESNWPARSLYEQAGFRPTDRRQPLPSNPALLERQYRLSCSHAELGL